MATLDKQSWQGSIGGLGAISLWKLRQREREVLSEGIWLCFRVFKYACCRTETRNNKRGCLAASMISLPCGALCFADQSFFFERKAGVRMRIMLSCCCLVFFARKTNRWAPKRTTALGLDEELRDSPLASGCLFVWGKNKVFPFSLFSCVHRVFLIFFSPHGKRVRESHGFTFAGERIKSSV